MEELELHPTVKPVQMIADAIRDVSGRGMYPHAPWRRLNEPWTLISESRCRMPIK